MLSFDIISIYLRLLIINGNPADRVAVGMGILMGIPIGFPYGWEWEFFLTYGSSHMWKSVFPVSQVLDHIRPASCRLDRPKNFRKCSTPAGEYDTFQHINTIKPIE